MEILRFTPNAFTIDAAAPDGTPRRTIMGLAAPYGPEADYGRHPCSVH